MSQMQQEGVMGTQSTKYNKKKKPKLLVGWVREGLPLLTKSGERLAGGSDVLSLRIHQTFCLRGVDNREQFVASTDAKKRDGKNKLPETRYLERPPLAPKE